MNCPTCQAELESSASACSACGATLVQTAMPTSVVVTIDFSPGTLFHSRYEILGPLGRGGMGMVYKAHDRTLDETVAIKVLRPDFSQDAAMALRFKSEIKLARRVRHKNVCTIHDFGEERSLLYISMELIEGVDLKHVLKQQGALPADKAYDVAIQISEGLQAVHDAGIIHRDLKTPNIMIDGNGLARLMDFGVAKKSGSDGTMTATGQVVGTPEYMSPEQAQGKKLDFRSDIYALGILTYEIFTGSVPFRGETPISTILKHLHDAPPLEGPQAEGLPKDLKPVLKKALAKEREERYDSATDFAEALRQARSPSRRQQLQPTAVLEAPTLLTDRPRGRRGLSPWLLALPLVAVAGGVMLLLRAPAAAPSPSPAAPPTATPLVATPTPEPATLAPAPAPTPTPQPTPRTAVVVPSPPPRPVRTAEPTQAPLAVATAVPTPVPAPTREPAASIGGLLQVAVHPWGEVSVDGTLVGTTPIDRIPLAAGTHTLKIRHPAYEVVERTVTIQPGQTERVVLDFPTQGVKKP